MNSKKQVDIRKEALKDSKAVYRLRQALIRTLEVGNRNEKNQKKLKQIQRDLWSLKCSIAEENLGDPSPYTSNPSEIEEKIQ